MSEMLTASSFFPMVLLCIIIIIYVNFKIASKFGEIAQSKGYHESNWSLASFFLGLPVWLMIIALPDITWHNQLLSALQKCNVQNSETYMQAALKSDELSNS